MTGCKGDDLWGSDAMTRAHQEGQYAGMDSGQEQIAGKTANESVNRAGHLSRCKHGSCLGGSFI